MNALLDRLQFPLIQGGMGVGISLSNLAGSVMKEGCMGVISAAHPGYRRADFHIDSIKANCEAIFDEVKKARDIAKEKGVLAINIMVASKDYAMYVKAAVKAKVDAIISGAGLPLDLPKYREDDSLLLAPIVSSGKAMNLLCRIWDKRYQTTPDFVVIEGNEAGGHLGFKKEDLLSKNCESLEQILSDVKRELEPFIEKYGHDIPVFVAGGIYDGTDIAKYVKLGAGGVQMGSRFIATHECDADKSFKQAIIDCKEEDIQIIDSPSGFSGRGLMNEFMMNNRINGPISMNNCLNCLGSCSTQNIPYCISEALIASAKGKINRGVVFAGSNAYRINKMLSVHELITSLKEEYQEEMER